MESNAMKIMTSSAYGNMAIGNVVYYCPRSFYMLRMRRSSGDGENDTGTPNDTITCGRHQRAHPE